MPRATCAKIPRAMAAAADRLPGARRAVEEGIAEGLHRGAQLYVSRHSEPLADWAVGEDRPGVPLTREHLMIWLSSSKPVAAVAIAQLWERGLLELDDPVARHVPEFAAGGKEGITLRHILTHTAGIRSMDVPWPGASWDELVARIAAMKLEPRWVPGQKAGYHLASSWFILGEVIRRLDGRPFETYVREAIFEPLGMVGSWIGMPVDRYRAYAAEGSDRRHVRTRARGRGASTPGGRRSGQRGRTPGATAVAPCASSAASTRCCCRAACSTAGACSRRRRSRRSARRTGSACSTTPSATSWTGGWA